VKAKLIFTVLEIAFSSLRELAYQFDLSCRLEFVRKDDIQPCSTKLVDTERFYQV
jgi:hypothetical protein